MATEEARAAAEAEAAAAKAAAVAEEAAAAAARVAAVTVAAAAEAAAVAEAAKAAAAAARVAAAATAAAAAVLVVVGWATGRGYEQHKDANSCCHKNNDEYNKAKKKQRPSQCYETTGSTLSFHGTRTAGCC